MLRIFEVMNSQGGGKTALANYTHPTKLWGGGLSFRV